VGSFGFWPKDAIEAKKNKKRKYVYCRIEIIRMVIQK